MTRAHGILALGLVLALAWAFALTQDSWWRPQNADKPITLWAVEPQDITRVEYTEGESHVVIVADAAFRMADGAASRWIEAEGPAAEPEIAGPPRAGGPSRPGAPGHPGAPAPQSKSAGEGKGRSKQTYMTAANEPKATSASPETAKAPTGAPKPDIVPPKPSVKIAFRGGIQASNVVRELARLTALRDLGSVSEKQLATYGLDKPHATLRIERTGGEPLILELGIESFGMGTRYGRLRSNGHVLLVNQGILHTFDHARRLMEREWAPFPIPETKRIDIKLGNRTVTLWHLDVPRTEPLRWALSADASKGDPAAQKWIQTLMGMKVIDYQEAGGPAPKSDAAVEITLTPAPPSPVAAGAPAGTPPAVPRSTLTLRVFKPASKDAAQTGAISPYTVAPVWLSTPAVQAVVDQARGLLGKH